MVIILIHLICFYFRESRAQSLVEEFGKNHPEGFFTTEVNYILKSLILLIFRPALKSTNV